MRKIGKKIMAVLAMALILAAVSVFVACGDGAAFKDGDYSLPENQTVVFGTKYAPQITVVKDVTIESVSLKDVAGSVIAVGEDYSFTPSALGVFTYTVVFKKAQAIAEETFSVTVIDTVAPVVKTPVLDKSDVEIGYYTGFADDLKTLVAEDNCNTLEQLKITVAEIAFGDVSDYSEDGFTGYMLDKIGTYTVKINVTDRSGNTAETSYKISTCDTTKPVIAQSEKRNVWINAAGKIAVPEVNVIETDSFTLKVTAKKGETALTVENGYITASGLGEYLVSYVATDASGNISDVMTMTLTAVESGLVNEFADVSEINAWETDNSYTRYEDGALIFYGSGDGAVKRHLTEKDWSDFSYLYLSIENYKAAETDITVSVLSAGKEYEIYTFSPSLATPSDAFLAPTKTAQELELDISKLSLPLDNISALIIKTDSYNAYRIGIKAVRLLKAQSGAYVKPPVDTANEVIGFETQINKDKVFGGGSAVNTVSDYVLSGTKSGAYSITAGGYTGEHFTTAITAAESGANTIRAYVFSFIRASVQLVGLFDDTELSSQYYVLMPGWNVLNWYVGIDNGFTLNEVGLKGLVLRSGTLYDITVYADCISFYKTTAFETADLAKELNLSVGYSDSLAVPSPFTASRKYVDSLDAALLSGAYLKEDVAKMSGYGINDTTRVKLYDQLTFEGSGAYTLVYSFLDVLGGNHLIVYPIIAEKNLLTLSAEIPVLKKGEPLTLPAPKLESDVISSGDLAAAQLSLFYRESGKYNWTEVKAGSLVPETVNFYEIKYEAVCGGYTAEQIYREFAHKPGIVADFEYTGGVPYGYGIDYNIQYTIDKGKDPAVDKVYLLTKITDEWAYDGDYSMKYVTDMTGWGGFYHDNPVLVEGGGNAVSFWLNANQPVRGAQFSLLVGEDPTKLKWLYTDMVELEAGTNQYIFKTEGDGFNYVKGFAIYIPYDPTKIFYFDTISYVQA